MSTAQRPTKDAYLLSVLRRRDDVLWAGEREASAAPTVIAQHVDNVRAQLPEGAGSGWNWVDSLWSWTDVRAASAGITRVGAGIRSISVGPREDDTFGVTVEVDRPSDALDAYVASLEPGLVRVIQPGSSGAGTPPLSPFALGVGSDMPPMPPPRIPSFDVRDLDLGDPTPQGQDGLPPGW